MPSRNTQSPLEIFQGALEKGLLDWETFFHLGQPQRADAEQLLSEQGYVSPDGKYEVSPGIRGIVPASRAPAHFTDEKTAATLMKFYQERNIQVSVREIA